MSKDNTPKQSSMQPRSPKGIKQKKVYTHQIMKDPSGRLTSAQLQALINNAPTKQFGLLLFLASMTGRRLMELCLLKPRDIVPQDVAINFPILKKKRNAKLLSEAKNWKEYCEILDRTTKRKLKKIDYETMNYLCTYLDMSSEDKNFPLKSNHYIFCDLKNDPSGLTPFRRDYVNYWLKWTATKAGIIQVGGKILKWTVGSNIHFHQIRHSYSISFIKSMKNAGDIRKLQSHLEHKDLESTAEYLKFLDTEGRETAEQYREAVNLKLKNNDSN
jgi:integrase